MKKPNLTFTGPAAVAAVALGMLAAGGIVHAAAATDHRREISAAQRAVDALEISNIMGRYAAYVIANKWALLGQEFALDEPDVRENVPAPGQQGAAVREYFASRDQQTLPEGVMHQHTFLSPIIEVAGDGKTAKGMWDAPGIDVGNGNAMAAWTWLKYAVDFKREADGWKIWHLHVYQVWRAPYGDSWSAMVQQASGGTMTGGGAVTGPVPGTPAGAPPSGGPPGPGASASAAPPRPAAGAPMPSAPVWRYNGKGSPPLIPAPPKPYYSFDPDDAY
jgi:hypothetical protein